MGCGGQHGAAAASGCAICGALTTPWHGFHVAHGGAQGAAAAATGAAIGATYCGTTEAGGHGAAATGTGAGGHGAPRLNQLHGQQGHSPVGQQAAQPPNMAGIAATASKVSIFFMAILSPRKAARNYCFGRAV
jgi:hypothetical protein